MAEAHYARLKCLSCSFELILTRGRPRKACISCRGELIRVGPEPGPQKERLRACLSCSVGFSSRSERHCFCSQRCANREKRKRRGPRLRSVICAYCHREVRRRVRTGKSSEHDAAKFCSRECAFAHRARIGAEIEALRRIAGAWRRHAKEVERRERADAAAKEAAEQRRAICPECGAEFIRPRWTREGCLCSDACKRVRRKKAERMSEAARQAKRKCRRARKMRQRGVRVEPYNDLAILERDRWRCKICGVKTPRGLRGTYQPNAPEVDHIIALANGGVDAPWNVQCTCRRCNLAKSDKGQFALPMFA